MGGGEVGRCVRFRIKSENLTGREMLAPRDLPCYSVRFERLQGVRALVVDQNSRLLVKHRSEPNKNRNAAVGVLFSIFNDTIRHNVVAIARFRFSFII